jgi:hypothetical protein
MEASSFHFQNKARGTLQRMCKECRKTYDAKFWKKKRIQYTPVKREYRRSAARQFQEWKSSLSCYNCGETESCCLDFHHNDPSQKEIALALAPNRGWSLERIMREAEKCTVLCANCHRNLHAGTIKL